MAAMLAIEIGRNGTSVTLRLASNRTFEDARSRTIGEFHVTGRQPSLLSTMRCSEIGFVARRYPESYTVFSQPPSTKYVEPVE